VKGAIYAIRGGNIKLLAILVLVIMAVAFSGCIQVPSKPTEPAYQPQAHKMSMVQTSERMDGSHNIRVFENQSKVLTIIEDSNVRDFTDNGYKAEILYSVPRVNPDSLGQFEYYNLAGHYATSMSFAWGSEELAMSKPNQYVTVVGYPEWHSMTVFITNPEVGGADEHNKLVDEYINA